MKEITKPVGIWLDQRKALIVKIDSNLVSHREVTSEIDEEHPVGGSGSSTPYGPQEAISEHRYLNRRHQQQTAYYRALIDEIKDCDGIYLMGPGQAKLGLEQELRSNTELANNLLDVETCQRMTVKQIKAKVMDYFHLLGCSHPSRRIG